MESVIDDFMGNIAAIIKRQRAEIASAQLRIAVLLSTSRHQADEIASLRAELAAKDTRIGELDSALLSHMDDWAEETILALRAEHAEMRAKFADYLLDYKAVHEIGAMRDLRTELAAARTALACRP